MELVDVVPEKVDAVNDGRSPIADAEIEQHLAQGMPNLHATLDGAAAYKDADFVIVATPTNYDPDKNFFDTTYVEQAIDLALSTNPTTTIVVKSTVPVGYTKSLVESRPNG